MRDEKKDLIKALLIEGKTVRQVAEETGVSCPTVMKVRKELPDLPRGSAYDAEKKAEMIALYRRGVPIKVIAKELGASPKTVSKYGFEDYLDRFYGRK